MSITDEDYPDLDISSSEAESNTLVMDHVIGAPPDSGSGTEDEQQEQMPQNEDEANEEMPQENASYGDDYGSDLDTGSDDFDVDEYFDNNPRDHPHQHYENDLLQDPLPMVSDALINQENAMDGGNGEGADDGLTEDVLKIFLSSSLMCDPTQLRHGYDPDELDNCVRDTMGYNLEHVGYVLLGDTMMENLPNKSKTEVSRALANAGWLQIKNSRFYPVYPESERDFVTSLIHGAEESNRRAEGKKRLAEKFDSESQEIMALRTFNMIADLLHAVRDELHIRQVQYQSLSSAYTEMVAGRKYKAIYEKYKKWLPLDPTKPWNKRWFNDYTKRSTLKKFLTTARFSEIVVLEGKTTLLYFRADDENKRDVKLFAEPDIEEVRQKWRTGNQKNHNFGSRGNYAREGFSQQAKKKIEQDPNYQPATFSGGLNSAAADDGSLEPTTSLRNNNDRYQSSSSHARWRRSISPDRREEGLSSVEHQIARDTTQENRRRSPENNRSNPENHRRSPENNRLNLENGRLSPSRLPNSAVKNPFGGSDPVQPKRDNRGNGGCFGAVGCRSSTKPIARVDDYGSTSSDSEFSSEGSYSDEEPAEKVEKNKRRNAKKEKKKATEQKKREQHRDEKPAPNACNRFQTYRTRPDSRGSDKPEPQSSTDTVVPTITAAAPLPQTRPSPPHQSRDVVAPATRTAPRALPLQMSSSEHDEENTAAQIPFRPMGDVLEKNKEKEQKDRERSVITAQRLLSMEKSNQHPFLNAPNPAVQQDYQRGYGEPIPANGFNNVGRSVVQSYAHPLQQAAMGPSPPVPRSMEVEEEYHGRNSQMSSSAPFSQHHPPIQHHPQIQQQMPLQSPNFGMNSSVQQAHYQPPIPQHRPQDPSNYGMNAPNSQYQQSLPSPNFGNPAANQQFDHRQEVFEPRAIAVSETPRMETVNYGHQTAHYQPNHHPHQMMHQGASIQQPSSMPQTIGHEFAPPYQQIGYHPTSQSNFDTRVRLPSYQSSNHGIVGPPMQNGNFSQQQYNMHQQQIHHNQGHQPYDPHGSNTHYIPHGDSRYNSAAPSQSSISRASVYATSNQMGGQANYDRIASEVVAIAEGFYSQRRTLTRSILLQEIRNSRQPGLSGLDYLDIVALVIDRLPHRVSVNRGYADPIFEFRPRY